MRRSFVILLALAALVAGVLGTLGVTDPSRRLTDEEPLWFAAIADEAVPDEAIAGEAGAVTPAPGVEVRWASTTRATLVGPEPPDSPYYDRFLLLAGQADGAPVTFGAGVDDAWLVRIDPTRPPVFALGLLRALHLLGITRRAAGDPDPSGFTGEGMDRALLPTPAGIASLAAAPRDFAPAMVNLLAYRDAQAYGEYGAVALRTVYGLGGRLQFHGRVIEVVRASRRPQDAAWEEVAAMRYPDPTAILTMERDPAYRAALGARDRGLAATEVIVTAVD